MGYERSKAKVLVVGEAAVGKRSLVHRSAFDPMDDRLVTTMGAKVSKKEIVLPLRLRDGTFVDLLLWTVSPSVLSRRRSVFFRGAVGMVAVCDATRTSTLEGLNGMIEAVRNDAGRIPVVLAVNKWDLASEREISTRAVQGFAQNYAAEPFYTSATTGENVDAAFQAIGERIVVYRRAKAAERPSPTSHRSPETAKR